MKRKVVVIGESGSGKTSILRRFVHNEFADGCRETLGVDFSLKLVSITSPIHDGDDATTEGSSGATGVKRSPGASSTSSTLLQLWDVAGQQRCGSMSQVYYRGAAAAVCVVDATRAETFESASHWKGDLDRHVFLPGTTTNIPCILLINKVDITPPHLSQEAIDSFCERFHFAAAFETSAKTGVGIDEAMLTLVTLMARNDRLLNEQRIRNAPMMLSPSSGRDLLNKQPKMLCSSSGRSGFCIAS